MYGPGFIDWGGDNINLRAAEDTEVIGATLVQQGITGGTILTDAIQFTAPETLEILALNYYITVGFTSAAQEPVPSLAQRESRTQAFLVTTEDDWSGDASVAHDPVEGDYFSGYVSAVPNIAWEDETNGTSGMGGGQGGVWYGWHDPGLDSETGPLFIREGDEINVHLFSGPVGADDIMRTVHRLSVWWAPAEEADETDVRQEFPSRRGTTI